jgi:muconate cycloisomerase
MQKLDEAVFGNPFAKAAIEMAVLDIVGKKLNTPLCDLIGGRAHDSGDEIPVKFVVAAIAPEVAVRNALPMVVSGFSTIKIKVGRNPQADIERVRAVREAVGPAVRLTVDANGGWTVADAVYAINRMEPFDLTLAEQPVPREDIDGLAAVRRKVGIPIMADESVFTVKEALDVIRREAADIISIYPGKNGGILKAQTIAKMAEAAGIPCHIGSNLELEVGSAAMAHLAVATANVRSDRYPADIIGPLYHKDSVAVEPFYVKAGIARLPEGPGLGVELDEEKVVELAT